MINGKQLEFYEREDVPDEETQEFIDDEIASAPKAPQELLERLHENHSSSPADSGGDIDASWEDVNDSGAESVFGHNPTPDQSDVEENAHAMGIDYEVRWIKRTKKSNAPRNLNQHERAQFDKSRDYMVRVDDQLMCKNIRCRKRFEIPSSQTVVFI